MERSEIEEISLRHGYLKKVKAVCDYTLHLKREKAELESRLRKAEEALAMVGERAVARHEYAQLKGLKEKQ